MMRWLFAAIIGGFLLSAAQAETLAPQVFTETFVRRLQVAWPKSTIAVKGDLAIQTKETDGRTLEISLANLYRAYQREPNRLEELIRTYLAGLPSREPSAKTAALDRTQIVPLIKDRPWLDETNGRVRAQVGKDALGLAAEDYNKELVIVYALDDPKRMRYLMRDELAGIKPDDLRTLALENLTRIMPKIQMGTDGSLGMMMAGGDYEASLLLYDNIWTDGTVKVKGDIVVAIPTRGMLLVTGSQDRAGLKRMREIVAKNADGPYRLTTALFVYRKGRFVKFGRD